MDSHLGKFYSGMLYEVRLWVAIVTMAEFGVSIIKTLSFTIPAVNIEVIASYRGYDEWF